jgi:hypothetical protein
MKKSFILFSSIALSVLGLALTTPSKSEFVDFFSASIESKINDAEILDDAMSQIIAKGILNLLLDYSVEERDFVVFKIFTVNMRVARAFGKNIDDIKFIGIAKQLIPLNKSLFENGLGKANGFKNNEVLLSGSEDYKKNYPDINSAVIKKSDLHDKTQIFVNELFNAISTNNDVALRVVEKFWAPEVIYFGRKIDKNLLVSEKNDFFQKWPLRNYISNNQSLEIECQIYQSKCRVTGLVYWSLQSIEGARRSRGSSEFVYEIDFSGDVPLIIEESSRTILKN